MKKYYSPKILLVPALVFSFGLVKSFALIPTPGIDDISDTPLIKDKINTPVDISKFKIAPNKILPNLGENKEKRCERITNRVEEKLERYKENENRHRGVYQGLENKLTNLISHIEEKGYSGKNVDALKADLEKLKELAQKFETAYTDYRVRLELLKNMACGDSDDEFSETFKDTQDDFLTVWDVIKEIRAFYLEEIKPDIAALKLQIIEERASEIQDNTGEEE